MRICILTFLLIITAGCAHNPALRGELLTPRNDDWNIEVKEMAKNVFLYGLLAREVYNCEASLIGNGVKSIKCAQGRRGFAYRIYERNIDSQLETIVVFRGTDSFFTDNWHGNLLGRQNKTGLAIVKRLREKLGADAKITVTGHSLGGGIASHVSINMPNIDAYVFNTSPRFWKKNRKDDYKDDAKRISVVEFGDPLKVLRLFGREPTQKYFSLGCTRYNGWGGQHSMANLARCLTDIAANAGDPMAINLRSQLTITKAN